MQNFRRAPLMAYIAYVGGLAKDELRGRQLKSHWPGISSLAQAGATISSAEVVVSYLNLGSSFRGGVARLKTELAQYSKVY